MTRLEKCKLAIEKGITYKEETGEIFGVKGNVLKCKDKQGYICFGIWHENKTYKLYGHQFAWFVMYNELVEMIDHINQVKTDNSKLNLRIATRELNSLNRNSLGVTYDKYSEKWISQIMVNGKNKNLGRFKEKQDAIDTYQK
jgi:hypothetical protein